ncbi:MAG: hypothetical protein Q7U36_02640 [bacterium]|nr:hypothetical protein [bacterium]
MPNKKNKNDEVVTVGYLDQKIDQVMLANKNQLDQKIDQVMSAVAKGFAGNDERFNRLEGRVAGLEIAVGEMREDIKDLKEGFNRLMNTLDGMVKKQEAVEQEFVIMKKRMEKIEKILKEKLGVEISAFV